MKRRRKLGLDDNVFVRLEVVCPALLHLGRGSHCSYELGLCSYDFISYVEPGSCQQAGMCIGNWWHTFAHVDKNMHIIECSFSPSLSHMHTLGTGDSHNLGPSRPEILCRNEKPPPLCEHPPRHSFAPGPLPNSRR